MSQCDCKICRGLAPDHPVDDFQCPFCSEPIMSGLTHRDGDAYAVQWAHFDLNPDGTNNKRAIRERILAHAKCAAANPEWKAPWEREAS